MLGADRDANQVLRDARADALLLGQLLVRRGPGVDGQRLRVADIRQIRDELEPVDDLAAGGPAPLHAEAQHAAEPALQVLLRQRVARVVLEPRVRHPADVGARVEVPRQGQRVLRVPLRPQAQRLDAQQELLRRERVQARPHVPQQLHPRPHDERDGPERVPEPQPVVPVARLHHLREPRRVRAPVELARVDDHAPHRGPVPADPFRRRVHYDVGPVVDGADVVSSCAEGVVDLLVVKKNEISTSTCRKCYVDFQGMDGMGIERDMTTHHDGNALLVRELSDGLDVRDVVPGVPDALDVDGLRLVVDGGGEVLGPVARDELGRDAEPRQQHLELVVGAAVQVRRRHDVVAALRQRRERQELRRVPGGRRDRRRAALERRDPLLEYGNRGLEFVVSQL